MKTKLADGTEALTAKKQEEKLEIKRKAIRFTKVVSLVGIRHATDERNSRLRRCVWVVWLVFGFAFAFYQIGSQVHDYFDYQSKIENRIKFSESLKFPQVTICNENTMMPERAKENNITHYMERIEEKLAILKNDSSDYNVTRNQLWEIVQEFHEKTKDWEALSRRLSQSLNETIVRVSFDNNETQKEELVEEIITDLGHCYAFSTNNKSLYTVKEGAMHGLIVVLNANRQAFPFNSNSKPGYKILIHDQDEPPLLKESGFPLELGMITRVEISMKEVTLQGQPYDKCDKEKLAEYRTLQCHAAKDYTTFKKNCNCIDLYMRGIVSANGTANGTDDGAFNETICSYAQIINCTHIAESLAILSNTSSSSTQAAAAVCQPQCYSPMYTPTITKSAFPLLMNEVSKIPGEAQVQNRFRVQIYYPHMSYIQADSSPAITAVDLICNISGALSLLLGATLLTVYEAAEFVVLFFKDYLQLSLRK